MGKYLSLVLSLMLWFNTSVISEEVKKNKTVPTIKDEYKVDLKNKKLQFAAELISSKEMLEVLACTRRGPTHESVFLIPPIGKKLHSGLKSIGLNDAIMWQLPAKSGKAGFDLSLGNKVIMKVYWEGQKESEAMFIEDLLVYKSTQVPMMVRGWTFKGDLVTKDGQSTPPNDVEISLVNKGRKNSPVILLLNPSNFLAIEEPEYVVADKYKKLLRPMNDQKKNKGIIIMQPATESQIVEKNIKRYPEDQDILKNNISLAKAIDELKAKFKDEIRSKMLAVIKTGSEPKISKENLQKSMTEYAKIELESQVVLNKIHYLYYLMMKTELQVIKRHMNQLNPASEEFNVFSIALIDFIAEEKKFIYVSFVNKLKAFTLKQKGDKEAEKKVRLQVLIDDTNAQIQRLSYRPILLAYQIQGDEARLKEKDVIESVVVKSSITKSVNRNKLDKRFYEKIITKEKLKISLFQAIQKDLSIEAKATPELIAFKNATVDAVLVKLEIKKMGYKNRLIILKEYMEEEEGRDQKYYIKEIKKANENLKKTLEYAKTLEESRKTFGTDTTDCFTFESKFGKLLN